MISFSADDNMVTVGLGEGLAIASIILQLVDVAQQCTEWVERFGAFGAVASDFHVRYNHEFRKLQALQHVLLDAEKFKLGKPLIKLMEEKRQDDIKVVLLYILRELRAFETLASKCGAREIDEKGSNADPDRLAVDVSEMALEEALPELVEREKFVQTKTTWIKKARWASTGKKKAEKTLPQIHDRLQLVRDEIDQFFWTFKIPETTNKGTADRLKSFADDTDLVTLMLGTRMRMRQLVLQLEMPPEEIDDALPKDMMIEGTRVQLGIEFQPGRWFISLDGRPAITECRTYTAETFSHTQNGMNNLCALLALDKDERFRLPKAEGLYHDEDAQNFHMVILSASVGAANASDIWSLNRSIAESNMKLSTAPQIKPPPLDVRMKLALDIAVTVAKFHSVGWLHQGIQSRNIALAVDPKDGPSYAHPFFLGYSKARPVSVSSFVDNDPLNNLYRHPARWQPQTGTKIPHTALHDLYSLGIVLLEIGLWKATTDMLKAIRTGQKFDIRQWTKGSHVQEVLLKFTSQLGFIAGSVYQEIVAVLLTAGEEDPDSRDWQKTPSDRRILHVIAALSEICAGIAVTIGEIESVF